VAMKSYEEGRDKILNKLKKDEDDITEIEEKPKRKPRNAKAKNI